MLDVEDEKISSQKRAIIWDQYQILKEGEKASCNHCKNTRIKKKCQSKNPGFEIFWNIPTITCGNETDKEIPLSPYGIVANEKQDFFGSKINIFYLNRGLWPHYEKNDMLTEVNGGIPQRGDIEKHLNFFAGSVNKSIPDPSFHGLAVIDFEEYLPSLSLLSGDLKDYYKQKSLEFATEKHPEIKDSNKLNTISVNLFNKAARLFFESTLKLGIQMRPNAKWGYYGFPYCYRGQLDNLNCTDSMVAMNNKNLWLYEASSALFPTIYLSNKPFPRAIDAGIWIHKVYQEVNRLRSKLVDKYLPAYPYFRFEYQAEEGEKYEKYLQMKDLRFSFKQALDMGMDGMIIWASSKNLSAKCSNISHYVRDYLGPISNISKHFAKICKKVLVCCNNSIATSDQNSSLVNYQPRESKCVKIDSENIDYIKEILNSTDDINLTYPQSYDKIKTEYQCATY
ncbi:hyaluronidase-like [Gordionus sp. m RMFG-2023]|uniref:hyaluronidase-like n=1 Tax=Gordionus sp. m RMFG-2023 TaxID=3053472 RepID=UPI0031FC2EE2